MSLILRKNSFGVVKSFLDQGFQFFASNELFFLRDFARNVVNLFIFGHPIYLSLVSIGLRTLRTYFIRDTFLRVSQPAVATGIDRVKS